jgi:hypothetical protein
MKFKAPYYKNIIPKNAGTISIAPVLIERERLKTKEDKITLFLENKYKLNIK